VAKKPTITEKIMFTQEKAAAFSCVNCRTFNGKMKGERKKCTLLVAKTCTLLVAKTCTFLIAKSCTLLFTVYIILLFPLFLIFFINSYGQKKIAGKNISVHQSVRTYLKSSTISEIDTVFSFNTPGNIPSGICFDGSNLWHCDTSMYIYKLSLSGEIIDSIPNPDIDNNFRGGAMTFDGNNIWIVGEETAKLFKIDINGNILKEFSLPSKNHSDPNGFGIAWDGNYLWHSQYAPVNIYKNRQPVQKPPQIVDNLTIS
jgi:hypothetical protein